MPVQFESTPRVYDGVQLDDDERPALELSPKFGLFRKLSVEQGKVDVEESLNKLRWNVILAGARVGQGDGGHQGDGGVAEEDLGSQVRVDDEFVETNIKVVDVDKLKVTELPYNPNVNMPKALDGEVEVRLHQVKVEVRDAVRRMMRRSEEWSNVSVIEKRGLEKLCSRMKAKEIVCFVTDKGGM